MSNGMAVPCNVRQVDWGKGAGGKESNRAKEPSVEIVLFWNRFREGLSDDTMEDYRRTAAHTKAIAEQSPGFISHKIYTAEDGERLSVVMFDSPENLKVWRTNPEHLEAQEKGRNQFYEHYAVNVSTTHRGYQWGGQEQSRTPRVRR